MSDDLNTKLVRILVTEADRLRQDAVAAGLRGDMDKGEQLYGRATDIRNIALQVNWFGYDLDPQKVAEFLSWTPERLAFSLERAA